MGDGPDARSSGAGVRHALFLPPVGELSDPRVVTDLAVAAEEQGWDGVFLWDHLLRPPSEPPGIADPWVTLAAVAARTSRVRIGPMVTPLPRRRPQQLAKEVATLDLLSSGRVTLGLGLGHDGYGEFSRFGDTADAVVRGDRLDEGAELLADLLTGEQVDHRGTHHTATDVRLLPPPAQRPRPPMWFAARVQRGRPVRRASRYDGIVPVDTDAAGLARTVEEVRRLRGSLDGFDVAASVAPGEDAGPYVDAGATWVLRAVRPDQGVAEVEAVIERDR